MSNIAIRVENIGKQYRIGGQTEHYKTLRDSIMNSVTSPFRRAGALLRGQAYGAAELTEEIWALRNVSFEVKTGEVVGIIGRNGAGKSTLLKILSRITDPTEGYADIYGRVGALLEVGTGFHNELTGRENIYLNSAILGMSRAEIDSKFDEIVNFAEVEKFIDTPVKHYSSGMRLRLGFAVAAHLEPEILVVDEVLAVGDAAFQRKCLGKMNQVAQEGRTVLFVSHDMGAVTNLCTRGILLDDGQIKMTGDVQDVISTYLSQGAVQSLSGRKTSAQAYIESAQIADTSAIDSGESVKIQLNVFAKEAITASIEWRLKNERGLPLAYGSPYLQLGQQHRLVPGNNPFEMVIGPMVLAEGDYILSLDVSLPFIKRLDAAEDCLRFTVRNCQYETSEGHSYKSKWNRGNFLLPFDITALGEQEKVIEGV